jgi:hypothetical protein
MRRVTAPASLLSHKNRNNQEKRKWKSKRIEKKRKRVEYRNKKSGRIGGRSK